MADPAYAVDGSVTADATGTAGAARTTEVARAVDGVVEAVRWAAVAAVVLLATWTQAQGRPGMAAASALAAVLALTNGVGYLAGRLPFGRRLASAWRAQLAVDCVVALLLVGSLRDAPAVAAVSLLLLPVVHAAVRLRLGVAIALTCVLSLAADGLLSRGAAFATGPAAVRAGALVMIAVAFGVLSNTLQRLAAAQQEARVEAARRAQLLGTVAAAARSLTTLDPTRVLAGIVDAAMELGFDCGEMCVLSDDGRHWRSVHPQGLPSQYPGGLQPVAAGVAGLVYTRRTGVALDDYRDWPHAQPVLRARGLRSVVALPVWSGEELRAVLTVGRYRPGQASGPEREALELLAAQAGRALENATRYEERERLRRELRHRAFHDALTGLPNRALLRDRLVQALARARRDACGVALLYCDLDGFKLVNDQAGHRAGDEALVRVAERLQQGVRGGDTVARLGGDEFTVLLDPVEGLDEALAAARRLLDAIEEPISLGGGHDVHLSASIGIACIDGGVDPPGVDELLQRGDQAMYAAKQAGKGAIRVYDAAADRAQRELASLDAELREALRAGAVDVHYQPILDAAGARTVAVEALARWTHPRRGPVPPRTFVPIAEQSGLIVALGGHVLGTAARQVTSRGLAGVALHVNLSMARLRHRTFLSEVEGVLAETGLPSERLVFEIDEAVVGEGAGETVREALSALRSQRVRVAVDGFGRGPSSLRCLRTLTVDEVKLDRTLVDSVLDSPEDRAIARWTIELAHDLGMRVTAVGVETTPQWRCLQDLGCDRVQGFLFAGAEPIDSVRRRVDARGAAAGRLASQEPPR